MNTLVAIYGTQDESFLAELKASHTVKYVPLTPDVASVKFDSQRCSIICIDHETNPNLALEMAQIFRMNYPFSKIYLVTKKLFAFDKKTYRKNGFDDAFIVPWEKASLFSELEAADLSLRCPDLVNYTPVFVSDLTPGEILPVNLHIFLSLNGMLLTLARAGEPLIADKLKKAADAKQNVLYIHKDEFQSFKAHYRETHPGQKSSTERFSELDHSCRELLSEIFTEQSKDNTFAKSGELLKELKGVLQNYVGQFSADRASNIISMFINRTGNPYNHAINVAIYGGLFAGVLNHPQPIDIALAGLFHDLGLSQLEEKYHEIEPWNVKPDEMSVYRTHVQRSMDIVRNKKLVLPERTFAAIAQHHEKMSGDGYPEQLHGIQICVEAKILAIADAFDYLTRQSVGVKPKAFLDVLEALHEENTRDPSNVDLDVHLLRDLIGTLKGGAR